jgi:hypothetical protein
MGALLITPTATGGDMSEALMPDLFVPEAQCGPTERKPPSVSDTGPAHLGERSPSPSYSALAASTMSRERRHLSGRTVRRGMGY